MINQQTDLALDSNQGSVLVRVVEQFQRVMRGTQATWLKLIDSEFARQVARPDEVPGGLVEYLIALANDQVKSADFTETLSARLEQLVSNKYSEKISEALNDAMDGYIDVAKRCIQILIDTVFNDIKPAVKILFTPSWLVDEPIYQIVETVSDYMTDFQARLSPSLFDLLVDDIIDTFLITYLSQLRKAVKFKMPQAITKMKEEIKKSFDFFAKYKNPKELESYFEVVSVQYPSSKHCCICTESKTSSAGRYRADFIGVKDDVLSGLPSLRAKVRLSEYGAFRGSAAQGKRRSRQVRLQGHRKSPYCPGLAKWRTPRYEEANAAFAADGGH